MKKRIFSLLVTLVLAVSIVIGVSVFASAEATDGLKGSAISLAENVTLKMEVAIAAPTEGAYAKITLPNGQVDATQLVASAPKNGNNFVFFAEIAIKDIAKDVTIEICNADSTTLVAAATTSALAYCNAYTEGEFVGIVNALKTYANAADYYFDSTKNFESSQNVNLGDITDPVMTGTLPAGIIHKSATLLLESETTIRHYFAIEEGKLIDNYVFFIDLDEDGACDSGEKLTPANKTTDNGSTVYYVEIGGITPNELDEAYTVGVKGRADGKIYTCKYGVMNYLKNKNTASASHDMKKLISAIYGYHAEAALLTGTVKFNANGGSAVTDMSYEYGVSTPIVAPTAKAGEVFIGWFDANGVKYDAVPSGQTGTLSLTAKWGTETKFTCYKNVNGLVTQNLIECADHGKAEFTDDKGVCTKCGYCTAANASSCWYYKGSGYIADTSKLVCSTCGKKLGSATSNGIFGFGDNRFGFAKSITLASGDAANLFAVSGGNHILATTFPKGSSVITTMFGANGELLGDAKNNTVYFDITVGRPTSAQIDDVLDGTNFFQVNDDAVDFNYSAYSTLAFRMGTGSATYSSELFQVSGLDLKVGSTTISNVVPSDGTLKTFTFALDFSDAVINDGKADTVKVYAYDENGKLLGSGTGTTKSGCDISAYTAQQIGQLRITNSGSILVGRYRMYTEYDAIAYPDDVTLPADAPKTHVYGTETVLPTPTKDGYVFGGWYLDEALTEAIEVIPANMSGSIKLYAKMNKIIVDEKFEDETLDSDARNSIPAGQYTIADGKLTWTPTEAWKTFYLAHPNDDIAKSDKTAFSVVIDIAKLEDVNSAYFEACMKFDDGDKGSNSVLFKTTTDNYVTTRDGIKVAKITEEGVRIVVTVDFELKCAIIYNEDGVILATTSLASIPEMHADKVGKELQQSLRKGNNFRIDSRGTSGTTVFDNMYLVEGYYFD